MYTEYERLIKVFSKETVDRPPCICPGGMMNMLTADIIDIKGADISKIHHDPETMATLAMAVQEEGCFENIGVPFCMTVEAEALGATVDFGSDVIEPHVVSYCYESVEQGVLLPESYQLSKREQVVIEAIDIIKSHVKDIPVIGNVTGPISTATSVIEPVVFYKAMRKQRSEAHEFLRRVTEQVKGFAIAQVKAGADVIAISDPSGTGEILGPKLFKEFVVPYINEITEAVTALGAHTIVHICGKMDKVYNEVAEVKASTLSFDALVNMREARTALKDVVLMGNISTYALEFATPEKIEGLTNLCMDQGVDIVAPACGLGMKSPLENIRQVLKTAKKVSNA